MRLGSCRKKIRGDRKPTEKKNKNPLAKIAHLSGSAEIKVTPYVDLGDRWNRANVAQSAFSLLYFFFRGKEKLTGLVRSRFVSRNTDRIKIGFFLLFL